MAKACFERIFANPNQRLGLAPERILPLHSREVPMAELLAQIGCKWAANRGCKRRLQAARQAKATSSAQTLKRCSVLGPKVLASATSQASRPRAISTRPMRGVLLRASKVYQRSPR